jgi:hypothetical protein
MQSPATFSRQKPLNRPGAAVSLVRVTSRRLKRGSFSGALERAFIVSARTSAHIEYFPGMTGNCPTIDCFCLSFPVFACLLLERQLSHSMRLVLQLYRIFTHKSGWKICMCSCVVPCSVWLCSGRRHPLGILSRNDCQFSDNCPTIACLCLSLPVFSCFLPVSFWNSGCRTASVSFCSCTERTRINRSLLPNYCTFRSTPR